MNQKMRTKLKRNCRRKRKYSEEEARHIAWKRRKEGIYVRAYLCPICDGWHVGKPYQRVRTQMAFSELQKNGGEMSFEGLEYAVFVLFSIFIISFLFKVLDKLDLIINLLQG